MKRGDNIQSGDFKGEKHVPVIKMPTTVKAGELFELKACVGEEIPHPNTPEHYISWIQLFYKPTDGKFITELGKFYFTSHADSASPTVPGASSTEPFCSVKIKLAKSGTVIAQSYCNIHGLWETFQEITVE